MTDIKFPTTFEGKRELPIATGRLQIGDHVGRLGFCPDGKQRLFIDKEAVADGSIVLIEPVAVGIQLYGFTTPKEPSHDG